ncbi:MAG: hypothetical protein DBX55_03885 [Verrucomicrobia bacterium]|nr:MAG: hypothetical protein DBX55_03885 [Verrucomicrobiota bacterium]
MIKLAVCDFDDTLVLERDFIKSGYARAAEFLAEEGFAENAEEAESALWREFSKSPKNVFDRFAKNFLPGAPSELAEKLIQIYRLHKPRIAYRPDVREFLSGARARGMKLAIVTDGLSETQHNKLDAVGAERDFDAAIVTSDFGPDWAKPSVKPFELLRDNFGIPFDETLYVGDNPAKDFAMSAKIPITTARILREGAIHAGNEYLDGITEHFRIARLPQIFDAIGRPDANG